MVDISPNFAGIIMGIVTTVSFTTGTLSPILVGYITFENQTIEAWKLIFQITAGMLLFSGTIYILFNDTSVQKWNKPLTLEHMKELKPLYKSEAIEKCGI